MGEFHIAVPRKPITTEYVAEFREFYEEEFEAYCKNPNCGTMLTIGDFIDNHFPYESAYNVCTACKPVYTLDMADADCS